MCLGLESMLELLDLGSPLAEPSPGIGVGFSQGPEPWLVFRLSLGPEMGTGIPSQSMLTRTLN